MSKVATSNAGDVKAPVVSKVVTDSELLAARIAAHTAPPAKEEVKVESTQPDPEPEAKEEAEESHETEESATTEEQPEAATEEAKEESKENDAKVLSNIDLEQLSEADLMSLANKTRSKAIARFGELTADKKALQQQIAALQAQISSGQQQKAAMETKPEIPKDIAALTKLEDLQAKAKQSEEVIEWAESVLDNSEHLASTDVAVTIDGRDYTKAQVKEYMRDARKVKDKYLPAQLAEINLKSQRASLKNQYFEKAKTELEWVAGEDNDLRKEYEAIANSPAMLKIKQNVPEVEPELDYIVMHAINSIKGKRFYSMANAEGSQKATVKVTPPGSVKSSQAGRGELEVKKMKELETKVKSTGSYEDYAALRIKQLSMKR
jgi:DNA polymerase III psi subunit